MGRRNFKQYLSLLLVKFQLFEMVYEYYASRNNDNSIDLSRGR